MIDHTTPVPGTKESLSSAQVVPKPTWGTCMPGNRSTPRNISPHDWERQNVIERTGGSVHVRCELVEVQHGNLGGDPNGDDRATLMVFQFRFESQKQSRRIHRALVNIEFFPAKRDPRGLSGPRVIAMAPKDRWGICPTRDHEVTSIKVGSRILGWSKKVTRDVDAATTVTGSMVLATGMDMGAYKCAGWMFLENYVRKTGVPLYTNVAVVVRRDDDEPFYATVSMDAHADLATSIEWLFRKSPPDDPVLFNPKAEEHHPRERRTQGVLNLSGVDLYSFCDTSLSSEEKCLKRNG